MKTLSAFLFAFTIVTASFAQIKYEKGYFINNANQRIECLIKNKDWKNNPKEFSYKLENTSSREVANLSSVKEFRVYNHPKYINAEVSIDRSKLQATELVGNENPLWSQEKIFLKILLEGKANLYCYDDGNGRRFFYSLKDSAISQLVYKKFRMNFMVKITKGDQLTPITKSTSESKISPLNTNIYADQVSQIVENNTYKNQLLMDLTCPNSILESVEDVNYNTEDLERYFNSYNKCMGDNIPEISTETKRSYFNLKITPGINSTKVSIPFANGLPPYEFKRGVGYRVGLEFESILPFNNDNWSLIIEPTFQSFHSNAERHFTNIEFKSIEFPVGIRYYFHLNDRSKIYVNGFYISNFGIDFQSKIELYRSIIFKVSPTSNWAFGGGAEHNRFSIEARYHTDRNLMKPFTNIAANYSRFSVILGYKIIKGKH